MTIYVTHSSGFNYKNELYQPLRQSELNDFHHITLPYEHSVEPLSSKEYLKDCDLVLVAEVSYPSTGQGIELGWADLYHLPIVCLYKQGMKLSRSLKVVAQTFIEYENSEDMVRKLSAHLSASQF